MNLPFPYVGVAVFALAFLFPGENSQGAFFRPFPEPTISMGSNHNFMARERDVSLGKMIFTHEETLPERLSIPLKRAGNLFFIEAKVDGQTGHFLFDSGASGLVVNRTYFRHYKGYESLQASGVTGCVGEVDRVQIEKIEISEWVLLKCMADRVNLAHIENRRGLKILGLFGFDLIRDFEVVLDFQKGLLELHRMNRKGNDIAMNSPKEKKGYRIKLERSNRVLFIKANMAKRSLRFCLDTGAETNVLSERTTGEVLETIAITRRSTLLGAGTSKSEVLFGTMTDFSMDGIPLSGMETILADLSHLTQAYGIQTDGVLGFDFFQMGIFHINFSKKELWFFPNKEGGPL